MSSLKWLPLESNPEVMNKCLRNLGVAEKFGVSDIISLDEDLLDMIPSPSYAVLLLFPVTRRYDEYCDTLEKKEQPEVPGVYYMKQTIRNACGTVALIHALANNEHRLNLPEDSVLKKFLDVTQSLTPEERGAHLEKNMEISALHEESAQEGQTETPNLDDDVNLHFISLVNVKGQLVELDGRKTGPIVHGETSDEKFIKDAIRVCKEYMARDPDNYNFNALSFGAMDN